MRSFIDANELPKALPVGTLVVDVTVRSERAELRLPMRALVVPYDGSGLVPVNDGTHPLVHTMPTPHEARALLRRLVSTGHGAVAFHALDGDVPLAYQSS